MVDLTTAMVVSAQKLIYSVFLTNGKDLQLRYWAAQINILKQNNWNFHGENIAIVKPTDEEPYASNNPKGFVGKALEILEDPHFEWIHHLDTFLDSEILRMELPVIREASLREFRGHEEEPSDLEMICIEARKLIRGGENMQF
ncbi:hypothetical protein L484_018155 [Morus notabilis]|uniref:1-phosphatidylinositol 4-kinase n=1 Tax=Morus notabilis TaxID=981085 RepID=W9RHR8_9ROSA|nr:hypothetical protein L484_018155 [Morus notabilis]